jgi:hypothetical protein
MRDTTFFDPLQELSLARTALDDPAGLPDGELPYLPKDGTLDGQVNDYAVEKIDNVLGALSAGHGNNLKDEARWALVCLGRLVAAVADEIEVGEDGYAGNLDSVTADQVTHRIDLAADYLDEAINLLQ